MKQLVVLLALSAAPLAILPSAQAQSLCFGRPPTIIGTSGHDYIRGTQGRDVILGKVGDDAIIGRGGRDLICAGPGDDAVDGQAKRDRIAGNGGPDSLFGGHGRDVLFGNGGNEWYMGGGPGFDRADGGTGSDDLCAAEVEIRCEG
jgi:Ca2+-binding RTX toxin-like protein